MFSILVSHKIRGTLGGVNKPDSHTLGSLGEDFHIKMTGRLGSSFEILKTLKVPESCLMGMAELPVMDFYKF